MADPERYWPGGIPSHVRCHDDPIPDLAASEEDETAFEEKVKGWQLFLEEKTTLRNSSFQDSMVNQRRQLVEEWASMSQDARDSYQERAPLRPSGWFPTELASTEQNLQHYEFCSLIIPEPISPRNRALWAKIRLMMHHLDGQRDTLNGQDDSTAILRPNPAGPNPITPDGFNAWSFVEPAMFENIAMTSRGAVVFYRWVSSIFFADQEALDTGRLLLCDLSNNGCITESARTWPVFTQAMYYKLEGLGHPAHRIIDEDGWIGDEDAQAIVDMEKPILDILEAKAEFFDGGDRGRDEWRKDIEFYAPGYLEMEEAGNGMALDYDHGNFLFNEAPN